MSCQIFISYRRCDSQSETHWLYEILQKKFQGKLFLDTGLIETGEEWDKKIKEKLEEAQIVLVIIGRKWLTCGKLSGKRRIDRADDWVRKEIRWAINRSKIIFPILINDATIPADKDLPKAIRRFHYRKVFEIKVDEGLGNGFNDLIKALTDTLEEINSLDKLKIQLKNILVSKYKIEEAIERGGKAFVYRAIDTTLGRTVAIKAIKNPFYNDEFIKVIKESIILTENVPNTVHIYGAWVDNDPIHVVMNYLAGGTLRKKIYDSDGKGLPLEEVQNYLMVVGGALIKAHALEIAHCNVKPSNVLISSNKEPYLSPLCRIQTNNEACILKMFSERETDSNEPSYREDLCYLAPEIFSNRIYPSSDRGEKIDQYMLGLMGYELLTGRIPYTIASLNELMSEHENAFKELDVVANIRKDCPSKLSFIIHKMISKNPDNRYKSLKYAIKEIEKVSFDSVEIAKDSYLRCLSKDNISKDFFKAFYYELIQLSPKVDEIFMNTGIKGIGIQNHLRQYSMLKDAIFMLLMFAEKKSESKEPNILTRIAEMHNNLGQIIPHSIYDHFIEAFINTVCGTSKGREAFDEQCIESENERNRIANAWKEALQPGIEYMLSKQK